MLLELVVENAYRDCHAPDIPEIYITTSLLQWLLVAILLVGLEGKERVFQDHTCS
jgi:hypothetical protein